LRSSRYLSRPPGWALPNQRRIGAVLHTLGWKSIKDYRGRAYVPVDTVT
jgi:hypothetical protein